MNGVVALLATLVVVASAIDDQFCGESQVAQNLNFQKIVGGQEAVPHSWPWQVSLRYNKNHRCGAVVLGERYVITAAHCTIGLPMSAFTLDAGRHSSVEQESSLQIGVPEVMWQHENYDTNTINNDITLFRLKESYKYNYNVLPICLPKNEVTTSGEDMWATGWGDVQGSCCSGRLKQALLPSISRADCTKQYYPGQITTEMICAGHKPGDGICFGDSGGPLASYQNGRWEVHGLSSWIGGRNCSQNGPGVFTNVHSFVSWINQKVDLAEADQKLLQGRAVKPIPVGAAFRKSKRLQHLQALREIVPLAAELIPEAMPY